MLQVEEQTFTLEQVADHHTTASLWVIVSGNVYDITLFMESHPGGEEILLQFGGKDITETLRDANEHIHSEAAMEMLEDYRIGKLIGASSNAKEIKENNSFIDVAKPMLYQVWEGNFSKDFYLKQVHIPRHTNGTAPLLGGYLEVFTKSPWYVIPMFWAPIIYYCMSQCLLQHSVFTLAYLFLLGILSWTLIEYTVHRFLFHLDEFLPDHRVFITLHFLLHGVHHFLPMDRLRLVIPPVLGIALAYPFWSLYVFAFPNGHGQGLISGAMFGFAMYDMMHFYLHHARPHWGHLRTMKSYHLDHHYKNPHLGFGITSMFWDNVFNTQLY